MKITLLGTGSPLPDPRRAGPATLVRTDGACILVDCGRGVLMRLAAAGVLHAQAAPPAKAPAKEAANPANPEIAAAAAKALRATQ